MRICSAITQHVGDHPVTGERLYRLRDVVTEVDVELAADRKIDVGALHVAREQLARLDAAPRAKAEAWLAEVLALGGRIDLSNEARWIQLALLLEGDGA